MPVPSIERSLSKIFLKVCYGIKYRMLTSVISMHMVNDVWITNFRLFTKPHTSLAEQWLLNKTLILGRFELGFFESSSGRGKGALTLRNVKHWPIDYNGFSFVQK